MKPVLEELQSKITAHEEQRGGQVGRAMVEEQPRYLARQFKVQRQARLKSLADDPLSHFVVLEGNVQGAT